MAEKTPIIVIDAGHGGSDSGAVYKGRKEKDDNLKLALAVGRMLSAEYIVKVGYTRTTDVFEAPSAKAKETNAFDADLFASFHRNSAVPAAHGNETLVYKMSGPAYLLAVNANKKIAALGFRDRGVKKRTDLTVLKSTGMPAVLFETGFISNKEDNKLFDAKFDEIVNAYVLAIAEEMNLKKKPIPKKKKFKNGDYNNKVRTTSNLNVRAGRGIDYKILGTLPKGTIVKALYILTKDGTPWASIDYGKTVGYISLKYAEPAE